MAIELFRSKHYPRSELERAFCAASQWAHVPEDEIKAVVALVCDDGDEDPVAQPWPVVAKMAERYKCVCPVCHALVEDEIADSYWRPPTALFVTTATPHLDKQIPCHRGCNHVANVIADLGRVPELDGHRVGSQAMVNDLERVLRAYNGVQSLFRRKPKSKSNPGGLSLLGQLVTERPALPLRFDIRNAQPFYVTPSWHGKWADPRQTAEERMAFMAGLVAYHDRKPSATG